MQAFFCCGLYSLEVFEYFCLSLKCEWDPTSGGWDFQYFKRLQQVGWVGGWLDGQLIILIILPDFQLNFQDGPSVAKIIKENE